MYSILKFGGTSMGSLDSINNVISIIQNPRYNSKLIIVVSAMSKVTDSLLELANLAKNSSPSEELESRLDSLKSRHIDLASEFSITKLHNFQSIWEELEQAILSRPYRLEVPKQIYLDYVASFGERMSSCLLTTVLNHLGLRSWNVDTRDFVRTDRGFGNANVDYELSTSLSKEYFEVHSDYKYYVATGFVARSSEGETTTLGRGGSDFTAGLIANFVDAKEVEIWTDVDGILSSDPRLVSSPKLIEELSFAEAFEVAYYGGKVLFPKTLEACLPKNIDIVIKNTFRPDAKSTRVTTKPSHAGLKCVSIVKNCIVVEIILAAITSELGLLARIFSEFSKCGINIDVVTTSGDSVSFTCDKNPSNELITKMSHEIGKTTIWTNKQILAVIGTDIVKSKNFGNTISTMIEYNPCLLSMNTKQTNLTCVVENSQGEELLSKLHSFL